MGLGLKAQKVRNREGRADALGRTPNGSGKRSKKTAALALRFGPSGDKFGNTQLVRFE